MIPRPEAGSATRAANRPRYSRAALGALLIVLLLGGICIPAVSAVSAATIIDESMFYYIDASGNGTVSSASRVAVSSGTVNKFTIHKIEDVVELYYLEFTIHGDWSGSNAFGPERIEEITYTIPGKETKTGRVHVRHSRNILGQVVASHALFFFDDWDVTGLTGKQYISTSFTFGKKTGTGSPVITGNPKIHIGDQNEPSNWPSYSYVISCGQSWDSHLTVSEDAYGLYNIKLYRHGYPSTLTLYDGDTIKYTHYGTNDIDTYVTPPVTNITVIGSDNTHTYPFCICIPVT